MFRPVDREKCQRLYDKYYAGRKFYDALYRDRIQSVLRPGQRLLDAGCGRYMTFCKAFSGVARVFGIDLESTLDTDNGSAPFGARADAGRLPFCAECFDVIISRSVVEHLDDPASVFSEFSRVLRPGGKVVIVTPNKWDYVSVIAALTPYSVHRLMARMVFQISEDDVFPTRYRANTVSALRKAFRAAGMVESQIETINHYPAYLMFSPVLFRLGVLYERITSLEMFRGLRGSILCVFEKEGRPDRFSHEVSTEPARMV